MKNLIEALEEFKTIGSATVSLDIKGFVIPEGCGGQSMEKSIAESLLGEYSNFKLNPEYKYAWLEALRSDMYKQGSATLAKLASDDRESELASSINKEDPSQFCFCCLGVYCVVRKVDMHLIEHDDNTVNIIKFKSSWSYGQEYLPDEMNNEIPRAVQQVLATLNDSYKASFAQIADFIEEYL